MTSVIYIPIFKTGYFIELRGEFRVNVLKQNKGLTFRSPASIGVKIKENTIKNNILKNKKGE